MATTLPARRLGEDAWPVTRRPLPWLIALLVAATFLTPFDSTELRVSMPVDLKLDRLLIAAVVVAWLLSRPRPRDAARGFRALHVLVALFVLAAIASLLVNAPHLVREGGLTLGLKKLSVLLSWAAVLVVVSAAVRPPERRGFLDLVLVCSTLTAAGVLVEYFTGHNVFFDWWTSLVPDGPLLVQPEPTTANLFVAEPITGPTRHALALAVMMAIALGYALAELLTSRSSTRRWLCVASSGLLLMAVFATNRKTGGFASAGMLLMLFAMRPRQTAAYVPLVIALFGLLLLVRPQAVEPQLRQLDPAQVAADASARGRIEDYRAITPDVRHRLAFGMGYGTYDPARYRILDNQVLGLLLETGLLGVATFGLILVAIPVTARRELRHAEGERAAIALAAAGASGAMIVSLFLFDALAFPATAYLLFFTVGLLLAARARPPTPAEAPGAIAPVTAGGADLAVVIVSSPGHPEWLGPCLRTLFTHAGDVRLDVIVIDPGADGEGVALVERLDLPVRAVRCRNGGFAYACNRGLEHVRGRHVLFLNPDTELLHGVLAGLVGRLDADPRVGAIGARQVLPDGRVYPSARRAPTALRELIPERTPWLGRRFGERELRMLRYGRSFSPDWVTGAFLLVSGTALRAVDGFDERFFLYSEDTDLCARLRTAGFDVVYDPSLTLLHHVHAGRTIGAELAAQLAWSRALYAHKHMGRAHRRLYIAALIAKSAGRALFARGAEREAARAALACLLGRAAPPFEATHRHALDARTGASV